MTDRVERKKASPLSSDTCLPPPEADVFSFLSSSFALYSLVARYANIARPGPNVADTVKMERYRTGDLGPVSRGLRRFLESSPVSQFALKVIGVLGVSMVMADGVLTPAQSVLGAIQGITVVQPDLGTPAIIGITCAILVLLFLVQPFGTAKIGTAFAPIVTLWLLFNLVSGIYNLVMYDHTVLKAFSPYFAFEYLIRNGHDGWKSLGGLLLAFTGVEALFADLGAFSKRAIQLSWLCLAFPCLLFAYIGQAAYISVDQTGTAFTNPFFYTVPPGTFYFRYVHGCFLPSHPLCGTDTPSSVQSGSCYPRRHCRVPGHDHEHIPAAGPGHEALVLSPYQGCAHEQAVPRAGVHAHGQLAAHDWHRCRYCSVQQRTFYLFPPPFSPLPLDPRWELCLR